MALSEEDKKEIAKLIGESLKSKEVTELIGTSVTGAVGEAVKGLKIEETVKAKVEEAAKGLKGDKEEPKKGGDKEEPKKDDATARQLAEIQAQLAQEREAREKAEQGRRQDALHSAARDALIKAGVPAERVPHAMAFLQVQGVLTHDDKGGVGFKGKNKYGQEATLPLEEGLKAWTESPDGKHYLPPKNVQGDGSGNKPQATPRTEKGAVDWGALKPNLGAALNS